VRWQFHDPATGETWSPPINPDSMTSPEVQRDYRFAYGVRPAQQRVKSIEQNPRPVDWTFSGVVRTQAHHDALVDWSRRSAIHITDHLSRKWEAYPSEVRFEERKSTRTDWRLRYELRALLTRRIA
jgi:hypothetical protein